MPEPSGINMSLSKRLAACLVPLTLGWILCWLIPGLFMGNMFALLDGSAPDNWKAVYVACLYAVIVGSVIWAWKKCGPRLGKDIFKISHMLLGLAFASVLSGLHWLIITCGGFGGGAFNWQEVPGLADISSALSQRKREQCSQLFWSACSSLFCMC